jgi:hypothetical protein
MIISFYFAITVAILVAVVSTLFLEFCYFIVVAAVVVAVVVVVAIAASSVE